MSTNRLPAEEPDNAENTAGIGMQMLSSFMAQPGINMIYDVYASIISDEGWDKLPAELTPYIPVTLASFLYRSWVNLWGSESAASVIKENGGEVGYLLEKIYLDIANNVIDDFAVRVPGSFARLSTFWTTTDAFKAPFLKAAAQMKGSTQASQDMSKAMDATFSAKTAKDHFFGRLEVFKQWRLIRPKAPGRFDDMRYVGSGKTIQEGREIILNEITRIVGRENNRGAFLYLCGVISEDGKKLMSDVVAAMDKEVTIDRAVLTYEENAFTVMRIDLVPAFEPLSMLVQSSHITYALMRIALSGFYKKIYMATASMVGAVVPTAEGDIDSEEDAIRKGYAAAMEAVQKDGSIDGLRLIAFAWTQRDDGSVTNYLDALDLIMTEDGFAFSAVDASYGRNLIFPNTDSINEVAWDWANLLCQKDQAARDEMYKYNVVKKGELLAVGIGIPLAEDPEIF